MKLKQAGQLSASYIKFHELAQLNVIMNHFLEEERLLKGLQNGLDATAQPDAVSHLHQNVKNIRYLYFRNRGFLYFAILKANADVQELIEFENAREEVVYTEDSFKKELFYDMLDGFSICPVYQEPDESLLRILDDLYAFLGTTRLRRFNLEYAVSFRDESDDIASILPVNEWAVSRLSMLRKVMHGSISSSIAEKLAFIAPYKEDLQQQGEDIFRRKVLNIEVVGEVTWPGVIHSVNLAVKQHQYKEKGSDSLKQNGGFSNPYRPLTIMQDSVQFVFRSDQKLLGKDHQNVLALDTAPHSAVESVDPEAVDSLHDTRSEDDVTEIVREPQRPDVQAGLEKSSMRLSKRLNREDYQPMEVDGILLTRRYFAETEAFVHNLNVHFKAIFGVDNLVNDIIGRIVSTEDQKSEPRYMMIFLQILNEWKPRLFNPVLLAKTNGQDERENLKDSDKKRLMDILTKFGNHVSDVEVIDEDHDLKEDSSQVEKFLQQINLSKKHVNDSKIEILRHLSGAIADKSWDLDLFDTIFEWYMSLEAQILQQYSALNVIPENTHDLVFLLSIYEVLINYYINCKGSFERSLESVSVGRFKSLKGYYSSGSIEVLRVHYRIVKWRSFLEGALLDPVTASYFKANNISILVRFFWATNYFIAADSYLWEEKRYVVSHLNELHSLTTSHDASQLKILFPNYVNIAEFSTTSLCRRLSTASILSIFSKILDQSGSGGNNDTIFLLESILLENNDANDETCEPAPEFSLVDSILNGHAFLDKKSLSSVKIFFDECPLDLKLSLWSMLFLYYRSHSHEKYQTGFEQFLAFIIDFLKSSDFATENASDPLLFVRLISSYTEYLDTFLQNLSKDNWVLKGPCPSLQVIANLTRVFELSYSFSLHEESALITGSKVSLESKSKEAFNFFKNLCVKSITTLLVYCVNQVKMCDLVTQKDQRISDLVSLVHYQLGIRRLCDASDGLFLTFAEANLMKLKNFPTTEITQLMSCRLHYKIKVDGKSPHDHYTTKTATLDRSNALELAAFVLPLCYKDNLLTQNFRNDLKQVVEDIYEIFGYPEIENDRAISENWSVLEDFLDLVVLGPRFIKEVFHGLNPIEPLPPTKENPVAIGGLYYLQAVLMFNSYKIRKKSAQSRTVELERIIALLKCDLVYGSKRAESWILLGQAYGFIVEDDTIWTSDKLNIPERKVLTAISQKKALTCYMMGIGAVARKDFKDVLRHKVVIAVLMSCFAKEMYSASRAPMDMIAFKVFKNPRFIQKDGYKLYSQLSETPAVSAKFCLRLMQRCLDIALRSDPLDWTTFYYLGKVRSKLGAKPEDVLGTIARAGVLAKYALSPNDPILEPAYKYYSLLYKFVKRDAVSVERGLHLLGEEPFLKMTFDVGTSGKKHFYLQVAACLTKLSSMDKKQWYHKPSYRLAAISFDDLNDTAWARRVISRFFTLKPHNKTFLQMWKPENERPGKHFVYMYQYTQFFLRILERDKDLTTMVLLFPKLRRANSSMVQLYPAWEKLCSILCQLIREVARFDSALVERFLFMTSYGTFIKQAKAIAEKIHNEPVSPEAQMYLAFLYELMEMRKLNNGYGPTSLIDDTFSGLFIKIYNECTHMFGINEAEQQPKSPNGKSKRLAKKDLFPFAVEIGAKQKRAVEARLKNLPNFFNEYVSQFVIEEVARSERSVMQSQRLWAASFTRKQLKESNRRMILSTVPGAHAPDFFLSKPPYVPAIASSVPSQATTGPEGITASHYGQYYGSSWQQRAGLTRALPVQNPQASILQLEHGQSSYITGRPPHALGPHQMLERSNSPMASQMASKAPARVPAGNPARPSAPVSSQAAVNSTMWTTPVPAATAVAMDNYPVSSIASQLPSRNASQVNIPGTCEICERNYALKHNLPYFKSDPTRIPTSNAASTAMMGMHYLHGSLNNNAVRFSPVEDVFYDQSLQNRNTSSDGKPGQSSQNQKNLTQSNQIQADQSQSVPIQSVQNQSVQNQSVHQSVQNQSAQNDSVQNQSAQNDSVQSQPAQNQSSSVQPESAQQLLQQDRAQADMQTDEIATKRTQANPVHPITNETPSVKTYSVPSLSPEVEDPSEESRAENPTEVVSPPRQGRKPLRKRKSGVSQQSLAQSGSSTNEIIIISGDSDASDQNDSQPPARKKRRSRTGQDN